MPLRNGGRNKIVTDGGVDGQRERVGFSGAFDFGNGFVVPPDITEITGKTAPRSGTIRVQLDGAAIGLLGFQPFPSVPFQICQREMRFRQIRVQFQSLLRGGFGFGQIFFRFEYVVGDEIAVAGGKFGVRQRVIRVNGDCLIEKLDRSFSIFRPAFVPVKTRFENEFVSRRIGCLAFCQLSLLDSIQTQTQSAGDVFGNFPLDAQQILRPAAVAAAPDLRLVGGVDQFDVD